MSLVAKCYSDTFDFICLSCKENDLENVISVKSSTAFQVFINHIGWSFLSRPHCISVMLPCLKNKQTIYSFLLMCYLYVLFASIWFRNKLFTRSSPVCSLYVLCVTFEVDTLHTEVKQSSSVISWMWVCFDESL